MSRQSHYWLGLFFVSLFLGTPSCSNSDGNTSTPSSGVMSGYVWKPLPEKYHPTQPELSREFLSQKLQSEYGLKKLMMLLERFYYPPKADGSRSAAATECRFKAEAVTEENKHQPLCLEKHLDLPDKWVRLEEFMRVPRLYPFPAVVRMQHAGFPFMDGNGFKFLGDFLWEMQSFTLSAGEREYFDPRLMTNRSLVFWSLSQYRTIGGTDLLNLKRALLGGKIKKHFFLIHHNNDNPEYPDWLLNHPLVLKVFGIDIPVFQSHPKLVPLPLGVRPHGKKIAVNLELVRSNTTLTHAPPEKLLHAQGFTLGVTIRRVIRRRLLHFLGSHFGFAPDSAGHPGQHGAPYYKTMLEHKFVLSLRGTGFDAFRTWEALYMGRPVLVGNVLPPWVYSQLPVVYTKLHFITPEELERAFKAMSSRTFNVGRLWMPWWMTFILRECLAVP